MESAQAKKGGHVERDRCWYGDEGYESQRQFAERNRRGRDRDDVDRAEPAQEPEGERNDEVDDAEQMEPCRAGSAWITSQAASDTRGGHADGEIAKAGGYGKQPRQVTKRGGGDEHDPDDTDRVRNGESGHRIPIGAQAPSGRERGGKQEHGEPAGDGDTEPGGDRPSFGTQPAGLRKEAAEQQPGGRSKRK